MALRPDRDYQAIWDVSHFWAKSPVQANSEEGGVASVKTAGSGVSLDDAANEVDYVADPSGAIPMGIMPAKVATYTGNRVFRNFHNGEIWPGYKAALVRKGWVVTNMISGTVTAAGKPAYLGPNGYISETQVAGAPKVGRFETTKDSDGYAKVYMDL